MSPEPSLVAPLPTDFVKFLEAVAALSYEEKIDYDRFRGLLLSALRRLGTNPKTVKLNFDAPAQNVSAREGGAASSPIPWTQLPVPNEKAAFTRTNFN